MSPASVVAAAGPAGSNPRGPPLTSLTSVVAAVGNPDSNPQGARHRRLQYRWWPLPDLPPAPPRGPPSTSSTSVVADAENPTAPLGGPPSTSSTSVVAATENPDSTPQGARCRRLPKLGTCHHNFSGDTYQGAAAVNITTTSMATSRKSEGWSFDEIFLGPCGAKNPRIIVLLQKLSPNQKTEVRH
jgi:hypothetical protein